MSGLDVVAGAVGIASFGIDVCKGLLWYYEGWKDYNADIASAYGAIKNLNTTLELLNDTLDRGSFDTARSDQVTSCLSNCKHGLEDLQGKLDQLKKQTLPEGFRAKFLQKAQRALYPFRAETLNKLQNNVQDVQGQLSFAMQVLQLETSNTLVASLARMSLQLDNNHTAKVKAWLNPPDPWINHEAARQRHEEGTGEWLLQNEQYVSWKAGKIQHLWLCGPVGRGKTVLCSTVVQDMKLHFSFTPRIGLAIFYFTFADPRKQKYEDMLLSIITQLGSVEPGLAVLRQAHDKVGTQVPRTGELETLLERLTDAYDKVFIVLDALDESPENDDIRYSMLESLERLLRSATNLSLFATSRDLTDIEESMKQLEAKRLLIEDFRVDADIAQWLSNSIEQDRRLKRMSSALKAEIEKVISEKGGGMFRWAYLQLQMIKGLQAFTPEFVKRKLQNLPPTLDETYERMLNAIDEVCRPAAIKFLTWLAYARSPPTLAQLAEAAITDPKKGIVDLENLIDPIGVMNILSGLVTVIKARGRDDFQDDEAAYNHQLESGTEIRLAHFSVKEYLESKVSKSGARIFHLEPGAGHHLIAQSCLTYLRHYSNSEDKKSKEGDLFAFPLLGYAAETWFYHSSLQQPMKTELEEALLSSEKPLQDWLLVYNPDSVSFPPCFQYRVVTVRPGLYYASTFGLEAVVKVMIEHLVPVHAAKGTVSLALVGASGSGHTSIVELLLKNDPDVNYIQPDKFDIHTGLTAIQKASSSGHSDIVKALLRHGADVGLVAAQNTALGFAILNSHIEVVEVLLESGANIEAVNLDETPALQLAAAESSVEIVKLLLDKGADIHYRDGNGTALHMAAAYGNLEVLDLLLDEGMEIDDLKGFFGTPLARAAESDYWPAVELLLDRGASIDLTSGPQDLTALQIALSCQMEDSAMLLRERGAKLPTASWFKTMLDSKSDWRAEPGDFLYRLKDGEWKQWVSDPPEPDTPADPALFLWPEDEDAMLRLMEQWLEETGIDPRNLEECDQQNERERRDAES